MPAAPPANISKPAAPVACHSSSVRRLRSGVRPSVATAPNSSHAPMATCSGRFSRSSLLFRLAARSIMLLDNGKPTFRAND
jgi:hypothetical protein